MRRENIIDAVRQAPFRPFVLCLANGERIEVRHPECVAVGGRTAIVVEPEDGRTHTIDIALIFKVNNLPLKR